MPLDKKGGFHMNPQVARMHNGVTPHKPTEADPGEQKPMHGHVEVHKTETGFKTVHHKTDGSQPEEKHHATLHHALHAVAEHHGGTPEDVHNHGEPDGDEYGLGGEAEMSAGADEY